VVNVFQRNSVVLNSIVEKFLKNLVSPPCLEDGEIVEGDEDNDD
jgi:hypothetical protein